MLKTVRNIKQNINHWETKGGKSSVSVGDDDLVIVLNVKKNKYVFWWHGASSQKMH